MIGTTARKLISGSILFALLISLPVAAQTNTGQVYTIQHNDTLWRLAEKYMGNGNLFPQIIEATAKQALNRPELTPIQEPNLLYPGQKIWVPAAIDSSVSDPTVAAPSAPEVVGSDTETAKQSFQSSPGSITGYIAFSFWNNHPNRCTYEVNVINVSACLQGVETCQATRRIMPQNNISEPALSPSGDRIAFRSWGEPSSEDHPYFGCAPAYPARSLGNSTLDGTDFVGTGGFWEDSHPDWSPDGNRLIFDTARNGDGITRIMTINPDGGHEEDLRIAGQQPSWGPDNERFVYRGCDLSGNACGLRVGLAVGPKAWETGHNMLGQVVVDSQASHPDWSPVADEIVYQSPASGSWDLYLVNVDGSNPHPLTSDPGLEGLPTWSPDGQWLAYVAYDGLTWSLRIISRDGSDDRLLFTYDGGFYAIPKVVEPYGPRDWLDEQISWSR